MKTFNLPEWFPDSVLLPATKYILGDIRDKEPLVSCNIAQKHSDRVAE